MSWRLRIVLPAALLVVLAALVSACGGGESGGGAALPAIDDLTLVADSTAQADAARFEMAFEMEVPGLGPFAFDADGAFDSRNGAMEMTVDLGSFAEMLGGFAQAFGGDSGKLDPSDWKMDMLLDGAAIYLRMPFLSSELPSGKEWVRIDVEEAARMQGLDLDQLRSLGDGTDPREALDYLRAITGGLEQVGTEDVRGVATTHYRATIDWEKYLQLVGAEKAAGIFDELQKTAGLTTIPVDVWVDADNLLRRLEMSLAMTPPGQTEQLHAGVTMELFDYGLPVTVTAPPASATVDVTEVPGFGA